MLAVLGARREFEMFITALLAVQAAAEPPRITVISRSSGYRAEATEFDPTQEAYVLAEIDRRAAKLCSERQVDWGKFGSVARIENDAAKGPPKVTGFFKEFRCVIAKEPVVASISSDWKASEDDDADVRRFLAIYYGKRDAGDFDGASAMFAADARPEKSTQDGLREFNRKLGSGSRLITGVTWYVNPASAPRLGAYAALDFKGEFTGVHFYCGYLVLYRLGPGSYEIVREEQNLFERSTEPVDPVQVDSMRAELCRGN